MQQRGWLQEQADTELILPVVDSRAPLEKALDFGVQAQPPQHGDILIVQRVVEAGVAAAQRAATATNGDGGVAAAAVAAGMSASAQAQEQQPPKSALSHYRAGTLSCV